MGTASKGYFPFLTCDTLFLLPALITCPVVFGAAGVWYSMPFLYLLASLVALVMLVRHFRKFKRAGNSRAKNV